MYTYMCIHRSLSPSTSLSLYIYIYIYMRRKGTELLCAHGVAPGHRLAGALERYVYKHMHIYIYIH